MSKGLTPGEVLTDFRLDDDEGRSWSLSELQGADAMVLQLGRGEHCPRERAHHHELLRLQQLVPVAFTTMVTVLPNDQHDTHKMKIATGAWWTFLSDADLVVQRALDIEEYTDTHHAATVPHTAVLAPGLVVDKVYCGYWFWGRPSSDQLWADLRDLFRRTKADFDPTTPEARAAWAASLRAAVPPSRTPPSRTPPSRTPPSRTPPSRSGARG